MAATAASKGVVIRRLFIVLIFVMVAAYAYVIAIKGYTSCFNLQARWAIALLVDFSIYVVVIGAWFFYKESSWIKRVVFVVLMQTTGSVATCGYILMQFYKLSPEEWSKDPLHFVLARHQKRDVTGHTRGPSAVTARLIFSTLGFLMLGALIYTVINDFSPSYSKPFTPYMNYVLSHFWKHVKLDVANLYIINSNRCLLTYLTDIYIHAVILSVWIAYKEPSWIRAFLWILSLVCLGNITTCVYIVRELFYLSPEQPISLIIFNSRNKDLQLSDPLLTAHD